MADQEDFVTLTNPGDRRVGDPIQDPQQEWVTVPGNTLSGKPVKVKKPAPSFATGMFRSAIPIGTVSSGLQQEKPQPPPQLSPDEQAKQDRLRTFFGGEIPRDPGRNQLETDIVGASQDEWNKAKSAFKSGNSPAALGYGLAATPVVGPMIESWVNRSRNGEFVEVAGEIAGMIFTAGVSKLYRAAVRAAAPELYEAALNIRKKVPVEPFIEEGKDLRSSMIKRGMQPDDPFEFRKRDIRALRDENKAVHNLVDSVTKDPNSASSQAFIPIPDILGWGRDYITTGPKRLGYRFKTTVPTPGAPTPQNPGPTTGTVLPGSGTISGPTGTPTIPGRTSTSRTVPGFGVTKGTSLMENMDDWEATLQEGNPPGFTTVRQAQAYKEFLSAEMKDVNFKEAAQNPDLTHEVTVKKNIGGNLKRAIEDAVPNAPVATWNRLIQRNIYLSEAIDAALRKNPNWWQDWAVFALGAGAEKFFENMGGQEGELARGGARMVMGGAILRMVARNPKIMARTAIFLSKTGESPRIPKFGPIAIATQEHIADRKAEAERQRIEMAPIGENIRGKISNLTGEQ